MWKPLVMKWKNAMTSLHGSQRLFPSPFAINTDVSRAGDEEPRSAWAATDKVANMPVKAMIFVKVCDP